MRLNLTEAGQRLGMSRTTVRKRIDAGSILAVVDPDTGWLLVEESEIDRYQSRFLPFKPPHELQSSQPSHATR